MTLYRPVGVAELALIINADWREFPPRLPSQPIFYPVLTRDYAVKIARDCNTKDPNSGNASFVLQFEIEDAYAAQFEVHEVGGRECRELWVLADELDVFNGHIMDCIRAVKAFIGGQALPLG